MVIHIIGNITKVRVPIDDLKASDGLRSHVVPSLAWLATMSVR